MSPALAAVSTERCVGRQKVAACYLHTAGISRTGSQQLTGIKITVRLDHTRVCCCMRCRRAVLVGILVLRQGASVPVGRRLAAARCRPLGSCGCDRRDTFVSIHRYPVIKGLGPRQQHMCLWAYATSRSAGMNPAQAAGRRAQRMGICVLSLDDLRVCGPPQRQSAPMSPGIEWGARRTTHISQSESNQVNSSMSCSVNQPNHNAHLVRW